MNKQTKNAPPTTDRHWFTGHLRTVILVPFLIQLFAAVGLIGYLSWQTGQAAVTDVASQLRAEITARIEERILDYVAAPQLVNELNAAAIQSGEINLDDAQDTEFHFWQQLQLFTPVTHNYVGSANGEMFGARWRGDHIQLFTIDESTDMIRHNYEATADGQRATLEETYEYDPRSRPWYQDGVTAGQASWSNIYADLSTGRLAITAVRPLYDQNGEVAHVLGSSFIFTEVNEFLKSLKIGDNGQTFIMERSGLLVSSSTQDELFTVTDDGPERVAATASSNPLISQTSQQILDANGDFAQIQTSQQLEFDLAGERQLVQVTPLQDDRGLDWLIVVVVPESDFLSQIQANTRNTFLLSLIALIIAVFVGLRTASWVTDPILRLNQAAKGLAAGDWQQTISLDRADEVGELTASFNSMAAQLRASFDTLEAQNEELHRLDKLKDSFLANTSHELRTPLNGIIGIAESMHDGATGDLTPTQAYNLSLIITSGRRLAGLVNDILDLSKLQQAELRISTKPLQLHPLVNLVMTLSQPLLQNDAVTLRNEVPTDLPLIAGDEDRLQQILHNLIGNGAKFTAKGAITISAQTVTGADPRRVGDNNASFIQITVADTGIGIPQDKLELIFESFQQVDDSITRTYGGTGLGLAVTRQLVDLHGGVVWAESELGVGSQFHFTMPISTATEAANQSGVGMVTEVGRLRQDEPVAPPLELTVELDSEASIPNSLNQKFNILAVDDEPINLQVLQNYLTLQDFNVRQAHDGPQALAMIAAELPDLILLDIMMPNLSGYETCERIRQQYSPSQLPIIMLTAKNQVSDLVAGFQAGANDYLTKPFAKNELLSRVNTHLRLAKISSAYARFVPREFLQFLQKESILEVNLGDQMQTTMTVMFADVRSFTNLSEKMSPKENFDFVNALLSTIGPVIRQYGGFIDKYIGDAVMALFPAQADNALQAAIAMQRALDAYNTQHKLTNNIEVGIGIHTGRLMLGTVGEAERMDTTVISDAVNLAARMEGLTKHYGSEILITGDTEATLQQKEYDLRLVDQVKVKGKSQPVAVYELFTTEEPEEVRLKQATLSPFNTAVNAYYQQDLATARSQFEAVLAQNPADLVAQMYIERITYYEEHGIPDNWDGITTLTNK
ncbi:MAG TPA: response regulator [Anaerolineae bacterium]|nr:response regulator [Anaerolineae bacterium]